MIGRDLPKRPSTQYKPFKVEPGHQDRYSFIDLTQDVLYMEIVQEL